MRTTAAEAEKVRESGKVLMCDALRQMGREADTAAEAEKKVRNLLERIGNVPALEHHTID